MLVGYARVSMLDQDLALPLDALRDAGCARIFTEQASGTGAGQDGRQATVVGRAGHCRSEGIAGRPGDSGQRDCHKARRLAGALLSLRSWRAGWWRCPVRRTAPPCSKRRQMITARRVARCRNHCYNTCSYPHPASPVICLPAPPYPEPLARCLPDNASSVDCHAARRRRRSRSSISRSGRSIP